MRMFKAKRAIAFLAVLAMLTGLFAMVPVSAADVVAVSGTTVLEFEDNNIVEITRGGSSSPNLAVSSEHAGYSGSGFRGGFKDKGDTAAFTVNVTGGGPFDLILKAACGATGAAHEGAVYVDDTKYPIEIQATGNWKDWRSYTIAEGLNLTDGEHIIKFVVEGDNNPGVYNLDCFTLKGSVNPYAEVRGTIADERSGIDISGSKLNHIENSDWFLIKNIDFGESAPVNFAARYAQGTSGAPGTVSVYIDALDGVKIADLYLPTTGDWNVRKTQITDCIDAENITGVHDVYFVFSSESTASICDLEWISFVDYSGVLGAIEDAKALTEANYTPDSWAALQSAVSDAESKITAANQAQNDELAAAIGAAIDALVLADEVAAKLALDIDISEGVAAAADADGKFNITWNAKVLQGVGTDLSYINENVQFKSYGVYYGKTETAVAAIAAGEETDDAKIKAFATGEDIDVYTIFGFRLKNVAAGAERAAKFFVTYEFDGITYTVTSDGVPAIAE